LREVRYNDRMKRLVLLDAHALIHRAYHALPPLTTSAGEPVNAVYGFASMFFKVLEDLKPDFVVAAFDKKTPTFRHAGFKGYKAQRPPLPDDLISQIPLVHKLIEVLGVLHFEVDGYEADDIIGTLSDRVIKEDPQIDEILIVTGDRDTLQLVGPKVKVYTTRAKLSDTVTIDEKAVWDKYGIKPKQMVCYKALVGDPSDNIPGVCGIGEKTAAKLLQQFGSLDRIYDNLNHIEDKTREKLINFKDDAFLSYKLAEIVRDVPLNFKLEEAKIQNFDKEKTVRFLESLGFKSLIRRLLGENKKSQTESKTKGKKENGQLSFI